MCCNFYMYWRDYVATFVFMCKIKRLLLVLVPRREFLKNFSAFVRRVHAQQNKRSVYMNHTNRRYKFNKLAVVAWCTVDHNIFAVVGMLGTHTTHMKRSLLKSAPRYRFIFVYILEIYLCCEHNKHFSSACKYLS